VAGWTAVTIDDQLDIDQVIAQDQLLWKTMRFYRFGPLMLQLEALAKQDGCSVEGEISRLADQEYGRRNAVAKF
jgi:hypothetical protein